MRRTIDDHQPTGTAPAVHATRVPAPGLVGWIGAAAVFVCGVVAAATFVSTSAARHASAHAASVKHFLEVARVGRDVFTLNSRLRGTAIAHLYLGGLDAEVEQAKRDFRAEMARGLAVLEQYAGDSTSDHLRAAEFYGRLKRYADQFQVSTPAQALQASTTIYSEVYYETRPSNGEWLQLVEVGGAVQGLADVAWSYLEYYLGGVWMEGGPAPADTNAVPHLESARGRIRQIRAGAKADWFKDTFEADKAARHDSVTGALIQGLAEHEGVRLMRAMIAYFFGERALFSQSPVDVFRQVQRLERSLLVAEEAVLARVDARAAQAGAEARRRVALGHASALAALLTATALLVAFGARRRRFHHRLTAIAETDALTGLGNRYALHAHEPARLANQSLAGFALLHIDVDGFKRINDAYGHAAGDSALVAIAERCRRVVRDARDSVTRIGGDEFVVVLHGLAHPRRDGRDVAERILKTLQDPVHCGGQQLTVGVSIGIATSSGCTELEDMMIESDLALYEAKDRGRNRVHLFGDGVRRQLIRDVPTALTAEKIGCHFQPQVDVQAGTVIGLEALARWDGSDVPTRKLIDVIEWLGETPRLLKRIMACVEQASRALGNECDCRFWINLSAGDLVGRRAADQLLAVLSSASVPLERLGVEVTETLAIADAEHARAVLARLRGQGVAVAIDDFGSGNTPLKHLTTLPLDRVKLDRSVVNRIDSDRSNVVLASAVQFICEHQSLALVAEGVERAQELAVLADVGVHQVQGVYLAPPTPIDRLLTTVRALQEAPARFVIGRQGASSPGAASPFKRSSRPIAGWTAAQPRALK